MHLLRLSLQPAGSGVAKAASCACRASTWLLPHTSHIVTYQCLPLTGPLSLQMTPGQQTVRTLIQDD